MSRNQDQDIIALLQHPGGHKEAFDLIVSQYHRKIYEHVRRMVIDHDDAADVVQEVFIKIWKHLAGFRKDAGIYTWIYRIASNEALNFIKAKQRRKLLPGRMQPFQPTASFQQTHEGEEIMNKLLKAVHSLPEKQQLVFHLRYFEELPYEDISAITQTSTGALKASYHFAVKKIEEIINQV